MCTLPESIVFVLCHSAQPCSSHETAYVEEDFRLQQHRFCMISMRARKTHTLVRLLPLRLAAPRLGMIMAAERDHTQAGWLLRQMSRQKERVGCESEKASLSERAVVNRGKYRLQRYFLGSVVLADPIWAPQRAIEHLQAQPPKTCVSNAGVRASASTSS